MLARVHPVHCSKALIYFAPADKMSLSGPCLYYSKRDCIKGHSHQDFHVIISIIFSLPRPHAPGNKLLSHFRQASMSKDFCFVDACFSSFFSYPRIPWSYIQFDTLFFDSFSNGLSFSVYKEVSKQPFHDSMQKQRLQTWDPATGSVTTERLSAMDLADSAE